MFDRETLKDVNTNEKKSLREMEPNLRDISSAKGKCLKAFTSSSKSISKTVEKFKLESFTFLHLLLFC